MQLASPRECSQWAAGAWLAGSFLGVVAKQANSPERVDSQQSDDHLAQPKLSTLCLVSDLNSSKGSTSYAASV